MEILAVKHYHILPLNREISQSYQSSARYHLRQAQDTDSLKRLQLSTTTILWLTSTRTTMQPWSLAVNWSRCRKNLSKKEVMQVKMAVLTQPAVWTRCIIITLIGGQRWVGNKIITQTMDSSLPKSEDRLVLPAPTSKELVNSRLIWAVG